tara:strand:- start:515 stop:988 length:474 start_codon:yes stop_codon:yes gene_type:complete
MNYPNAYKTDALYITKFEKDVKNSMSYQFIGAFPVSIAATPVSYDQSDILKCTVSFSYMRYLRRRSGAGSERIGFAQRRLRGEKSWYIAPPRSYKRVEAGPVSAVKDVVKETTTEEIQVQSAVVNSTIFDSTAIPGDYDYKGDNYQGVVNGILIPKA